MSSRTIAAIFALMMLSCKQKDRAPQAAADRAAEQARSAATSPAITAPPTPSPKSGKGNLEGEVRYAGAPAVGIEVKVCETFSSLTIGAPACGGRTFETKTDARGHYLVRDLDPKTYGAVMVRVFETETYQYATGIADAGGATKHQVQAGSTRFVGTTNLIKGDLFVIGPRDMARTTATPSVRWASYSGATSYRVSLTSTDDDSKVPINETVTGTSFTPSTPLAAGRWAVKVVALGGPGSPKGGLALAESTERCEFIIPSADDTTPLDDGTLVRSPRPARPPVPKLDLPSPPPGAGAVQGLVLYAEQPAAGIAVKLCETFSRYAGCSGKTLTTKTDARGVYTFGDVPPKEWQGLTVRVFNTRSELFVSTGLVGAKSYSVIPNNVLSLPPTRLFKSDVRVTSPAQGATLKTRRFAVTWAPYPGATSYRLEISATPYRPLSYSLEVIHPSFVLDRPLDNGSYEIDVTALDAWGAKLAVTDKPTKFSVMAD